MAVSVKNAIITSQKGGGGRTTLVSHLARPLAERKRLLRKPASRAVACGISAGGIEEEEITVPVQELLANKPRE
jgi:hypothetical protein